jgi:hypothetical protein
VRRLQEAFEGSVVTSAYLIAWQQLPEDGGPPVVTSIGLYSEWQTITHQLRSEAPLLLLQAESSISFEQACESVIAMLKHTAEYNVVWAYYLEHYRRFNPHCRYLNRKR